MSEGTAEKRDERNIMILFLSNYILKDTEGVQTFDRRFEGKYRFHDGTADETVCTLTNEAPVRDVVVTLHNQGKTLHKIVYFITDALKDGPVNLLDKGQVQKYETKEELFKKRICAMCHPFLDETEFVSVPFNDKSEEPMQECIKAVVRMETEIKKYMSPDVQCHLFADITGGLRTANMAMAAVIQLLQYKGIQVDLVLYSYSSGDIRSVSDVRDVDNLYNLVSGVEVFTKYGRSDTIERYFDFNYEEKATASSRTNLEELLVIMHRFADAMSLCWHDHIKRELPLLVKALDGFPEDSDDVREKMLIQLLPTIREKYDRLLFKKGPQEGEIDRLAVIEWCIENNLIQQALTFCTEWLPQYIVEYGAFYADDPAVQMYCRGRHKDGDEETNGKKYFVMDFPTIQPTQNIEKNKNVLKKIQNTGTKLIINSLIDRKGTGVEHPEFSMEDLAAFLRAVPNRLHNVQNGNMSLEEKELYEKEDKIFIAILEAIAQSREMVLSHDTVLEITEAEIFDRMKSYDLQYYRNHFYVGLIRQYPYREVDIPDDMDRSEKAKEICGAMLRCGMVKTIFAPPGQRPDYEKAMECIRQYTYIRANIRNTSHHVGKMMKTKMPQTFTEVKNELKSCLKLMKDLVEDERAIAHKAKNVWPDALKEEEKAK